MLLSGLPLLLLLIAANGAPILAHRLLGPTAARPIDGGRCAADGRPWLGASKTWRGLLASLVLTVALADAMGFGAGFGAAFAASAMLGDLGTSYVKRRWGLARSARATGLDQVPEALLPMLLSHWWLEVGWLTVLGAVAIFFLLGTQLSPLLYRLGIRRRPY